MNILPTQRLTDIAKGVPDLDEKQIDALATHIHDELNNLGKELSVELNAAQLVAAAQFIANQLPVNTDTLLNVFQERVHQEGRRPTQASGGQGA